jgi:DNA-binding SARP family transcriptional activator/WD40 repeat protein
MRQGEIVAPSLRFCVLGPLRVLDDDYPIVLGPPKQRRLMAVLIAHAGKPVSADALVDAVWEEGPPRSAAKTLQGYVVHLRQAIAARSGGLGDGASIVTVPGGYRLEAAPNAVDAVRFSSLLSRSRAAVATQDWTTARVFLTEALSLWRGPAYAEFADSAFAAAEAARLEELRLVAAETGFEIDLVLGEDAALVPELEKALTQQPTRERLWELLIRALYLSGRQSDALLGYLRARDVLATELGVDPGPELRAVHAAVLAQDPSLDRTWSPPPGLTARQPRSGVYAFDGRDEELAWLRDLWLATLEHGGRSAVIYGPAGIGKTRLLAAFADEVQRSEAVVVRRTGLTAPNLVTVAAVAGDGPVLVVLDDPLTGVDLSALAGLPVLVIAGIDPDTVSAHVKASLASAHWRQLPPLSDDVGARIARRWLGEGVDDVDVEPILRTARGNPGLLHTLLAETVEQRSKRQINAAVGDLRTARADVISSRTGVAYGVRGLRRGRALLAAVPGTPRGGGIGGRCPYLGLEAYELGDAELFHGRDTVVEQLVARVADTALVAVVGASGSGKSSLVKAGLLAALSAGCLPGSASWPQFVVTPVEPLPAPSSPAVVVVDQFEQAWVAHDEVARGQYLDAVVSLAEAGCRVVLTVRADHVDRCSRYPRLRDLVAEGTVLLGPHSSAELTQVIVGPAELAGCDVETALVERLLDDVRGLAAPLPLVSTALAQTWERATTGTLTLEAYLDCGGVAGALARRADLAYAALTPQQQDAARRVLVRLATGEPGMLVGRRCPYPEAAPDDPGRLAVDALAAARLVTVDSAGVEVAHEALFDNWPRLADWLEEDEQGRRLRAHLAPAALDWDQHGRPDTDLYRGVRLDAAMALAPDHDADLTPTEREFLAASAAHAEQELLAERARATREARARRRLRGLFAAVAATAALAMVAAFVAVTQRNNASDNARRAISRQLSAAALIHEPLDRSLLLAVSAVRIDDNVSTRSNLLAALQQAPAAKSVWHGDGLPLYQLVLTDNDRTAIGTGPSGITIWDLAGARTPARAGLFDNEYTPLLAHRPGTDVAAVANLIGAADFAPSIQLWDPRAPDDDARASLTGSTARTTSMAWTADGRWLAAGQQEGDILVWDVDDRTRPPLHIRRDHPVVVESGGAQPLLFPAVLYAGGMAFAVVEQSGEAQIRSPFSTGPSRTFSLGAGITSLASDPRGTMLAAGHRDGTVTLFSLADGRPIQALPRHAGAVQALSVSLDGRLVASLGDDGVVNVTEVGTGRVLGRFAGHTEPGTAAAFSADRRTLYTASTDGVVVGWDLVNVSNLGAQLSAPMTGPDPGSPTTISRAGYVATGFVDGTVRVWAPDGASAHRIKVSNAPLVGAALSPDGGLLAASDSAGVVKAVNVRSGRVVATIDRLDAPAYALAFSPDAAKLALVDDDLQRPEMRFYATSSWRRLGPPEAAATSSARQLAWSPDARSVAVGSKGYYPSVFAADTGAMHWQMQGADTAISKPAVAWSPDGAIVAVVGDTDIGIQLLRASDGTPIGGGWRDHAEISAVAYSPDGSVLASTGPDRTIVLRDVATGNRVGPPVSIPTQEEAVIAFDAKGRLIIASRDGGLWRWDISLPHLLRAACAIAGRNLTTQEWAALHTGLPYVTACP